MKLTKRIKLRRRLSKGRWFYCRVMPIGYYKNRPQMFHRLLTGEIGKIETVRFVVGVDMGTTDETAICVVSHRDHDSVMYGEDALRELRDNMMLSHGPQVRKI